MPIKSGATDRALLKTAAHPLGINLPTSGWVTGYSRNEGPSYFHMTDWSGGLGTLLLPAAPGDLRSGNVQVNLAFAGTAWTANGNEVRCGPLRTANSGTAIVPTPGGGVYTDGSSNVWAADKAYVTGSYGYIDTGNPQVWATAAAIASTTDDTLYQSERYWTAAGGGYRFDVPNGTYTVVIKFAEIWYTAGSKRVFDVVIEGAVQTSNLDVFTSAGGANTAYDVTYTPITVSDGHLDIGYVRKTDNPKINAISVVNQGATPAYAARINCGSGVPGAPGSPSLGYTAAVANFVEASEDDRLYFSSGSKKYYVTIGDPVEVDTGGTAGITDMRVVDGLLYACLGTATACRTYTFSTTTWAAGEKMDTIGWANGKKYWASNPSSGGVANYLYWGTTAAERTQVGGTTPITRLIEFNSRLIIIKKDGIYDWLDATKKALLVQSFSNDDNNGRAVAIYNDALYFSCGAGLWVWRDKGAATPVPLPEEIDRGQISRVYSLQNIDRALVVGFLGWCFVCVEDPVGSGRYWWHYVATNSGKTFQAVHYTVNLGLARPRIFFGFSTDTTNNLQYIELQQGVFLPYTYAASSYIIMPGIYAGMEMYPAWFPALQAGYTSMSATQTVQWATTSTPPTASPSWTNFGSAVVADGISKTTAASDVQGVPMWFKATLATATATASPVLHFWRARFYHRIPLTRTWTITLPLTKGGSLPGGGRQRMIDVTEADLSAARDQNVPASLTIKSENVADVKVWVDFDGATASSDARRSEKMEATIRLICREAI